MAIDINIDLGYALAAWVVADFLSGVVHWIEDRYGDPAWPVIGRHVIEPNILHHRDQMAFTAGGYWQRNWTTLVPAAAAAGMAWLAGSAFLAVTFLMLSQANEIHAWAHQRCVRPIRGLQLIGIFQSPEQHADHHRRPFDRNYCTMSDWLNPLLSRAGFWPALELLVARVTGLSPRPERQVA
jgi:ubiquitin-conjugating enzyme E2 variant